MANIQQAAKWMQEGKRVKRSCWKPEWEHDHPYPKAHKYYAEFIYSEDGKVILGSAEVPASLLVPALLTREEIDRFDSLCDRFPEETFRAPLVERNLGKEDCLAMIERAGIEVPMMYRLGYDNANCIGCPKGGQAYWQNIRADFPERFVQIQLIQEQINTERGGDGTNFLRFRSGPRKGQRMSLAELPEGRGDMKQEPSFNCSFFCQMAEQEIESA